MHLTGPAWLVFVRFSLYFILCSRSVSICILVCKIVLAREKIEAIGGGSNGFLYVYYIASQSSVPTFEFSFVHLFVFSHLPFLSLSLSNQSIIARIYL